MTTTPAITRQDRLRRVLLLCCSFARNLAYYRVGRSPEHIHLQQPEGNPTFAFWRAANGNFIDMCVLEWCKLFADKRGKHYWANIVNDPVHFKDRLLHYIGIEEAEFQKDVNTMLRYRDKFIAHLDSDPIMFIPALDAAKMAVWFYYGYVLTENAINTAGLPLDLDAGYMETEEEARIVYRKAG